MLLNGGAINSAANNARAGVVFVPSQSIATSRSSATLKAIVYPTAVVSLEITTARGSLSLRTPVTSATATTASALYKAYVRGIAPLASAKAISRGAFTPPLLLHMAAVQYAHTRARLLFPSVKDQATVVFNVPSSKPTFFIQPNKIRLVVA
jgi:hypothetical protein